MSALNFELFEPKHYKLGIKQVTELNEVHDRLTISCLGDLSLYSQHPDWFLKCSKSGAIDYDSRHGPRRILEPRRALRHGEDPLQLLEERLAEIRPNRKELKNAKETLKKFLETASGIITVRAQIKLPADKPEKTDEELAAEGAQEQKQKIELSYRIHELTAQLGDLRLCRGVIPESCIRSCEDMLAAVIEPSIPYEERWREALDRGSQRAITVGGHSAA